MKYRKLFSTTLIAVFLLFANMLSVSLAMEDAIIARVNNELITLKDLKDYIRNTYMELVSRGLDEKQIEKIMLDLEINGLNKLIEDKVILSRANAIDLKVRDELIDERVQSIIAKYPSEQDFLDALVVHGGTITELRDKIRDTLKIKFVVEHEVKSRIIVKPQEVTEFYETNSDRFQKNEQLDLDSIFLGFRGEKNSLLEKANEIYTRLKKGEDFQTLAKKFSDTPSIGIVEKGGIHPDIEKAVFSLEPDSFTAPIEVENGIFIFKLLKRIPPQRAELSEVREYIHSQIFNKKFRERFLSWLDNLKENAYIEIKE